MSIVLAGILLLASMTVPSFALPGWLTGVQGTNWGVWSPLKSSQGEVPDFTITQQGNVGVGVLFPDKKLEVNGAIMADEVCIRGKNECVKTFQQSLSNTQYFNFRNDNPYGGP